MTLSVYVWVSAGVAIATALGQSIILAFMHKKGTRTDFPAFYTYNAAAVVAGIVLTIIFVATAWGPHPGPYFYFYMAVNAALMVLEFAVMYEVVSNALKPYSGLIDLGKMLFRWAGVFLIIASGLTAFAAVGPAAAKYAAGLDLLHRSLRLMQCGLLLLFFVFERRLSLSWRSRPVSIAFGLGISSAFGLGLAYLHSLPDNWALVINLCESFSYLAVVGFWAVIFGSPQPQRKNVMDSPSRLIFQRWNETLAGYGYGSPSAATGTIESFLPGIERTVDRVMARRVQ